MNNSNSVRQLIEVLTLIDRYSEGGDSLFASRKKATRDVAQQQSRPLFYQTILDLYTRRLGYLKTSGFDALVQDWQAGNPRPLMTRIKNHADSTAHGLIDQFFREHPRSKQPRPTTPQAQDHASESEQFDVRIPHKESEMLRFIAKMRHVDPLQLLNQIVSRSIRNEMKTLAHDI